MYVRLSTVYTWWQLRHRTSKWPKIIVSTASLVPASYLIKQNFSIIIFSVLSLQILKTGSYNDLSNYRRAAWMGVMQEQIWGYNNKMNWPAKNRPVFNEEMKNNGKTKQHILQYPMYEKEGTASGEPHMHRPAEKLLGGSFKFLKIINEKQMLTGKENSQPSTHQRSWHKPTSGRS